MNHALEPGYSSTLLPPFRETVQYFANIGEIVNHESVVGYRDDPSIPAQAEEKKLQQQFTESVTMNVVDLQRRAVQRDTKIGKLIRDTNKQYRHTLRAHAQYWQARRQVGEQKETQTAPWRGFNPGANQCDAVCYVNMRPLAKRTQGVQVDSPDWCLLGRKQCSVFNPPLHVLVDTMRRLTLRGETGVTMNEHMVKQYERFCDVTERIQDMNTCNVKGILVLDLLWSIQGIPRNVGQVKAMVWHPADGTRFAIAYDTTDAQSVGFVCVWNVRNTGNPERLYSFPSPVLGLSYSLKKPHYLLVLCVCGALLIIDTRPRTKLILDKKDHDVEKVIVASNQQKDRTQLKRFAAWCGQSSKYIFCGERDTLWKYIVKRPDIVKLKEIYAWRCCPSIDLTRFPQSRTPASVWVHSIQASSQDDDIVFVSTSEGTVYTINVSHKTIDRKFPAPGTGAERNTVLATCIDISPFLPQMFLCSYNDATIRLWHLDVPCPLLTLTLRHAVRKARWSPLRSTVIISITHREVQVWDLSIRTIEPCGIQILPSKYRIMDFVFSKNGTSVCVGDEAGNLFVFKIMALLEPQPTPPELQILYQSIRGWDMPDIALNHLQQLTWWNQRYWNKNTARKKHWDMVQRNHPDIVRKPYHVKPYSLTEKLEYMLGMAKYTPGRELERDLEELRNTDKSIMDAMKKHLPLIKGTKRTK
uniref:Dynein axonemal intermediate chain 4 n=1 Tax=Cacopsylla melanoneura TaxID=428564 RepID=A0A8D9E606_9HEMI